MFSPTLSVDVNTSRPATANRIIAPISNFTTVLRDVQIGNSGSTSLIIGLDEYLSALVLATSRVLPSDSNGNASYRLRTVGEADYPDSGDTYDYGTIAGAEDQDTNGLGLADTSFDAVSIGDRTFEPAAQTGPWKAGDTFTVEPGTEVQETHTVESFTSGDITIVAPSGFTYAHSAGFAISTGLVIDIYPTSSTPIDYLEYVILAPSSPASSANFYRVFRAAPGYEHNGVAGIGVRSYGFTCNDPYSQIHDMECRHDAITGHNGTFRAGSNSTGIVFAGCMAVDSTGTNIGKTYGFWMNSNTGIVHKAINCTALRITSAAAAGGRGFRVDSVDDVDGTLLLNCSAIECDVNFMGHGSAATTTIKNCLSKDSQDSGISDYGGLYSVNSTNNASVDGTEPGNNGQSGTFKFIDETNDDYRLDLTDSVARANGADLESAHSYNDDVEGIVRRLWDIGPSSIPANLIAPRIRCRSGKNKVVRQLLQKASAANVGVVVRIFGGLGASPNARVNYYQNRGPVQKAAI